MFLNKYFASNTRVSFTKPFVILTGVKGVTVPGNTSVIYWADGVNNKIYRCDTGSSCDKTPICSTTAPRQLAHNTG